MDNFQIQFAIAAAINGLVQLIVLLASIIMLVKKRCIATVFLFTGSLLNTIGYVGGYLYNIIAAQKGTETLLDAQVTLTFFNAFSFFVFGVGFLLLAINYFNKNSIETVK
ncbi:MAG: hypothetical protein ABJM36_00530 [Algibacter sp.]|uniref:hypothetical protein n=1 Tax=Algibacter sp. TaxID=1872428 RepID=UPI0032998E60